MVLIYDVVNLNVVQFFSGDTSQIGWIYSDNPKAKGILGELIVDDNSLDISNPLDYRVANNSVIPKVHVNLMQNDKFLNIGLDKLQDFDEIDKIPVLISGKRLELEPGEYEIELNSNKPVEIHVDSSQFTYEPLVWEVD